MTHLDADGLPLRWAVVPDRQAIARSDTDRVMGIFAAATSCTSTASGCSPRSRTSSTTTVRSAPPGCSGGAIAWVEVSVPESITTPEGVVFRPNLLATTSFDGSIATTFKRTVTDTVCDNTRDGLAEPGQQYKVKHSRYSVARLAEAREALAMVHTLADDFAAEVAKLCATPVTTTQWQQFLDLSVPRIDAWGRPCWAGR